MVPLRRLHFFLSLFRNTLLLEGKCGSILYQFKFIEADLKADLIEKNLCKFKIGQIFIAIIHFIWTLRKINIRHQV